LQFKHKSSALTSDIKTGLKDIAVVLKDNPELTVTVTAYPEQNDPKQRITDKRLEKIKDYLMEQAGVSGDRISTEKKPGEGSGNRIDFKTE
jgi:outer membrane protein OmpA-like peptidoglycan-associated protein